MSHVKSHLKQTNIFHNIKKKYSSKDKQSELLEDMLNNISTTELRRLGDTYKMHNSSFMLTAQS